MTFNDTPDRHPSWSPDGGRIAFDASRVRYGPSAIYTIRPNGSNERRLVAPTDIGEEAAISQPIWSHNGDALVVAVSRQNVVEPGVGTAYNTLYLVNQDGSGMRPITSAPFQPGTPGREHEFSQRAVGWSHEGESVLFWSSAFPPFALPGYFTVQRDGSHVQRTTLNPSANVFQELPTGQLYLTSCLLRDTPTGPSGECIESADGTSSSELARDTWQAAIWIP